MNWYKATLARVPTNFSQPFIVAIQARDMEHAESRLYKLYDSDIYDGIGKSPRESLSLVTDPDEIEMARKHPLKDLGDS